MNRRKLLKSFGAASALGTAGIFGIPLSSAKSKDSADTKGKGGASPKITKVRAILTAPYRTNLVVVKVETDQAGLYGVGCATFTQRAHSVVSAVKDYLDPFFRGRSVGNIEENWQMAYQSSYWRNGPVLNNALSGVDQALWDIKGKMAGMPVYDLLGGKTRFAVDAYGHASGKSVEEVVEDVGRFKEMGYRNIRIQLGGYGSTHLATKPSYKEAGFGMEKDRTISPQAYKQGTIDIFKAARETYGDSVELLHDMHERLQPMDAIDLLRRVEEYRPFFMEDPLSPENIGWFRKLREQTSVPIAMGELFNSPHEWLVPMSERLYDYIRIHVSQIGGITPAMKVARLGEWFNVRTAWHGPGDTSPVGHAAHCHIDLAVWNFGVQEIPIFKDVAYEVFPGMPRVEKGYIHVNEAPGLGIDIDEKAAAKYPPVEYNYNWTQVRRDDGTPVRP
ncbi:enolase C-terminal domain-like protein [Pelagicoccus mobilis]|uniref:Bifunctional D-altronate/D-mannonate dehydratase n=1 Tax=Pelagicoccus mobilis TaxID=415221 RepID=A0A934RYP0_9BACT|nr:enolase C-terminal domain-like protein [Pelagicoccus mobilis]MBK1879026.1 bifunctional D-altronate/D-mannonate dehydratase [Pelagicoccus mobilis]